MKTDPFIESIRNTKDYKIIAAKMDIVDFFAECCGYEKKKIEKFHKLFDEYEKVQNCK